jgi:hypothetical protein
MTLPNPVPLLLFHCGSLPLWVGPSRNDQLSQIGSHRPESAKDFLSYPSPSWTRISNPSDTLQGLESSNDPAQGPPWQQGHHLPLQAIPAT